MKLIPATLTGLAIGMMLLMIGCKKDSNPVSSTPYVDAYNVNLTETKGTVHTGDYFPLRVGLTCNYSGSADLITLTTVPGYPPMTDTVGGAVAGMMKILPLRPVPLTSGTFQLYPMLELTFANGSTVADTSRFFMKDTAAVYIKALKLADGSFLEVTNPVFVKTTLVVGDVWETAPQVEIAEIFATELGSSGGQSNLKLDARAKFFVVGKEAISLPFGLRNSIRLEQANDISLSGTIVVDNASYAMTLTAKIATVIHMIADTGIAHENATGNMNITLTRNGETANVAIQILKSELNITSVVQDPSPGVSIAAARSRRGTPSVASPLQSKILEISRVMVDVFTRKLTF